MSQRRLGRRTWSVVNSIRAGLLAAVGAFSIGPSVTTEAFAQTAPEMSEGARHVDLPAARLHAGSTAADVERIMGEPSAATELGGLSNGDTTLVYSDEPVQTRITLRAGRVSAIALDVAYVEPLRLPVRAHVIKATMMRGGVIHLLGTPYDDLQWVETGRKLEQMIFTAAGEPEFSVFLCDGLVVDAAVGRNRPPNLASMLLPVAVSDADAAVNHQLALGLSDAQVAQLVGPSESTTRFLFKNQPVEYATYRRRGEQDLITATFIGGVLTAFTLWPSDES